MHLRWAAAMLGREKHSLADLEILTDVITKANIYHDIMYLDEVELSSDCGIHLKLKGIGTKMCLSAAGGFTAIKL